MWKNKEVLRRVKEKRNIVHEVKRKKSNGTGHILHRNHLLKHTTEGQKWWEGEEEEDVDKYFMNLRT
jgi:hypothetical protein